MPERSAHLLALACVLSEQFGTTVAVDAVAARVDGLYNADAMTRVLHREAAVPATFELPSHLLPDDAAPVAPPAAPRLTPARAPAPVPPTVSFAVMPPSVPPSLIKEEPAPRTRTATRDNKRARRKR